MLFNIYSYNNKDFRSTNKKNPKTNNASKCFQELNFKNYFPHILMKNVHPSPSLRMLMVFCIQQL